MDDNMKTVSERVAAYRKRKKDAGQQLCQVYAYSADHKEIRNFSALLTKKREDENAAINNRISEETTPTNG